MKGMQDADKSSGPAVSGPKWLLWINGILISFILLLLLFTAALWFSDRLLMGIMQQIVNPRLNRLAQKNPDLIFNLTETLTVQSLASKVNHLLKQDPQGLSRFISAVDPVLLAGTLNWVFKENPEQISLLLKHLEARAMSGLNSHILRNNRSLLVALITSVDRQALGEILVDAVSHDPRLFSKGLEGLRPTPFSRAFNHSLNSQKEFLSEFLGSLDMGSIAALIDKIAKEHPDFMNELVDKIVELIRKDFMKSGIY